MKKLAVAAIVAAVLAIGTSGAALYRTRHLSSSKTNPTSSEVPTSSAQLIEVPDMTNVPVFQAGATLTAVQLKFTTTRAPSDIVVLNSVISQTPAPATTVPAGTVVQLTVSSGPS